MKQQTTPISSQDRRAFLEDLRQRLEAFNESLDDLEERIREMSSERNLEAQRTYQQTVEALRARRDAFVQRMQQIETSSGNAWREIEEGTVSAWEELQAALQRAREEMEQAV